MPCFSISKNAKKFTKNLGFPLKGNPGLISGFTQDQRFFMSWATVWRTKSTEKYMVNQVKTDPHSPGYFRAFGPLVNQDSFYNAFDVKEGDKLYKKPEERIKIW